MSAKKSKVKTLSIYLNKVNFKIIILSKNMVLPERVINIFAFIFKPYNAT